MRPFPYIEKSEHQQQVEAFMLRMNNPMQRVPLEPTMPSDPELILRAKLIFEEAMETIRGLGVSIQLKSFSTEPYTEANSQAAAHDPKAQVPILSKETEYHFYRDARLKPDIVEIVDGCCDLKVVTTGTLSACGVPDVLPQRIVDQNNLDKFAEGHYIREDGKLIKPPTHKPCTDDLKFVLRQMLENPSDTKAEELGLYGSPYAATVKRSIARERVGVKDQNGSASVSGQGPLQLD